MSKGTPPKTMADIFLGKRDNTTLGSCKADRHESIRKTMKLNPNWVPLDGTGHRVHVDVKTNDVKRVVPSRLGNPRASGSILRGEAAAQEFRKPLSGHAAEFERLASLGISHDPDKKYVMDVSKRIQAQMARKYVGAGGYSNNSEIEYDLDTHVASRAGYRMFKSGIGFIHTNGAVSGCIGREGDAPGNGRCACGSMHVA